MTLKVYAMVLLKVRVPEDKTLAELKEDIRLYIKDGCYWVKQVEFKTQEVEQ